MEASINRPARTELSLSLVHACCHRDKPPSPSAQFIRSWSSLKAFASWRLGVRSLSDCRLGVICCTLQLPISAFYTNRFNTAIAVTAWANVRLTEQYEIKICSNCLTFSRNVWQFDRSRSNRNQSGASKSRMASPRCDVLA